MEDKYSKARNTIIKMMMDRGYTTPDGNTELDSVRIPPDQFSEVYARRDNSLDITGVLTPEGKPVYVKFLQPDVITTRSGTNILRVCFRDIATHFCVDLTDDIATWPWAKKYKIIMVYDITGKDLQKETLFEKKYSYMMEVFQIDRITFDYINHIYQPRFTRILPASDEYREMVELTGISMDPNKQLKDYGLKNGSKLIFVVSLENTEPVATKLALLL